VKGCRGFSEDEIARLAGWFEARGRLRDRALLFLGVNTGYRISELLSLRRRDVLVDGRLVDEITMRRGARKGKRSGHALPLNAQAKRGLAPWLLELQRRGLDAPGSPLFASRKGAGAITRWTAWYILHHTARRLGMSGTIGTHSMRKTFGRRGYEATGHDVAATQGLLGHARMASTFSYLAGLREGDLRRIVMEMGQETWRPHGSEKGNA